MANRSVEKFQAVMAAIPQKIKAEIRAATFVEAGTLAAQMQFRVHVKHGTLRNSIRVEGSPQKPMRALVKAGGPTTTVHGYDYSLAQEFGTSKMSAQPLFWPTYRANKARIRRAIRTAAKDAISRIVPLK